MDDNRHKPFFLLGPRQKRRRLAVQRHTNAPGGTVEAPLHSNSSSEESLQNNEEVLNPPQFAPEDDVSDSGEQEVSDYGPETDSSNEEESSDELYDVQGLPIQAMPEDNVSSDGSFSDNELQLPIANVHQNLQNPNRRALKNAFLAAGLKHTQGNIILKALRGYPFHFVSIPKDTRTLLQTPNIVASRFVQQIAGGEYLHIGFKNTLLKKLESVPLNLLPDTILIDFNTDGGKVDKGLDQVWPHQFRVYNIPDKRPMVAGVFKGRHKPSNPFEFYEQFVQEIVDIREEGGILIGNQRLPVVLRCFIADAPARAFVLNHYGHTSSHACSKCRVEGRRCVVPGFQGTMIFPGIRHRLRTDEEYQNLVDEDHHKGRSPLAPVLGLVTRVPFESMHVVWIGNVKKVLSAKVSGKHGHQRLNGRKVDIANRRMILLRSYCPSEFNRRPNEVTLFHNFKATEFRQLLLYTAPAVFKNVFDEEYYRHFMILHCVMRLLVSEETPREMYDFCQEALESYVRLCEELYGEQFLSYNVHSLLHLVEDVKLLGSLETISAFPYENNMSEFRKFARKPDQFLQQYYKRTEELNDLNAAPFDSNIAVRLSQPHTEGPILEDIPDNLCRQYKKLQVGGVSFATTLRDSCCLLKDSKVCLIRNIIQLNGDIFLIAQIFQTKNEIYNVAVSSSDVGVWQCTNLTERIQAIELRNVKNKVYRMPKWNDIEGQEVLTVENHWICVSLLTPLVLPENLEQAERE